MEALNDTGDNKQTRDKNVGDGIKLKTSTHWPSLSSISPLAEEALIAIIAMAAASAFCMALLAFNFSHHICRAVYFLTIYFVAIRSSEWISIPTSLICLVLYDYLCVPPVFTFFTAERDVLASFSAIVLIAMFSSRRTRLLRQLLRIPEQSE